MDEIDLSKGQSAVLSDAECLRYLPDEILELIKDAGNDTILDTLSRAALIPELTLELFARFEEVFADTAARWIERDLGRNGGQDVDIIAAFARILPFAPSLSVYLERYLSHGDISDGNKARGRILWLHSKNAQLTIPSLSPSETQRLLLATYRLLIFDKTAFAPMISEIVVQPLLEHSEKTVRYLAIRILCILLSTSDSRLESMIEHYVGRDDAVMGDYDGRRIDYGFLSLYEERRAKRVRDLRKLMQERETSGSAPISPTKFSQLVTSYRKTLLPRPNGSPSSPSTLVPTSTTRQNQEAFTKALLSSAPILIHGLSGSGKTALVNDFARELGMDSTMVTLHLNEQTDAKMLIGMYATDSTPGSFKWRPGVLTTAVREGRWVLIEDLDRAPNEVISVILPLIERSELIIPNRGEVIKAARGFKLIASIRTSLNMSGNEAAPSLHMLGARLWHRVPIQMPSQVEFQEIINGIHPILHKFVPDIIRVYNRVYTLFQRPSFASQTRTSLGRPISPRDLLKWCSRLDAILVSAGSKTGEEPIQESTKDEMFLEAADCFAASLQTAEARSTVIYAIAEEMHISPPRVEHFLSAHVPRYEDIDSRIDIGRVTLGKRKSSARNSKPIKRARPFANTSHAKRLLEQVGVAVKMAEPVLLVGETGIGKTTVVQQLADSLGFKLTAVNLSQQSEVGDLLGGFKPVNVRSFAIPLKDEFDELFAATGISASKNQQYLTQLGKYVAKGQWLKASKLWHEAPKMFEKIVTDLAKMDLVKKREATEQPAKKRKTESKLEALLPLKPRWNRFSESLKQFDLQIAGGSKGFAFTFVEGNIIKAVRNGDWVLLDEINLASPDTLESIADLLHSGPGSQPSILLSETGEIERIKAHPDFRIFGAMNPATDVGKRDLPMGLRSRFTEIYVESPDRDLDDLLSVIKAYLRGSSSNDERAAHDVARLYINTKRLADEKRLVDGANQVPHFSLRTLTRTLSYVNEIAPSYGLRRALYEGFSMSFLTLLNRASESMLMPLIDHHLLDTHKNSRSLLSQTPRHPDDGKQYVRFVNKDKNRQYWMLQGREPPQEQPHYIITNSVERNMLNLVRATSTRRFPVLVQGPTSSGKTSMIEYLAKYSGNKFVRINNHEHTDLQEYLGTYVSGPDGQLRFQEGLLVQALRQGHWIVLDELNLAPTDVLEALNRLLDDNRELLIPETQEIVRPHENFMLFATQNPPGLYGGRKTLSRAFRNRFLELHFDDIPEHELHTILTQRSQKVAPSDCERIVRVYKELSTLRQSSRLFEQKDSFATLRDLFRWSLRDADNRAELAANGYMLLAERVRKPEERLAVKEVIERVMKEKIDPNVLYDANLSQEIKLHNTTANSQGIVWTSAMRRLYVLVSHALRNNEPVLLVGETGCGKTTVCQMLAEAFGKELHILNAHQNTETGDLIGAQRPLRNRAAMAQHLSEDIFKALSEYVGQIIPDEHSLDDLLLTYNGLSTVDLAKIPESLQASVLSHKQKAKALFEWSDGGLVQAMKEGQFYLLDEISLADDSVLERLNSVLEPSRALLLAEKGVEGSFVQAANGFQFFATMNPGGDYGKRELSPALRNRFTEIWVPSLSEIEDVLLIVETKLRDGFKQFASPMVQFSEWFGQTYRSSSNASISVRDMLAWVAFINSCGLYDPYDAVLHGAAMVYVDTLGANPAALLAINPESLQQERSKCLRKLGDLLGYERISVLENQPDISNSAGLLTIGLFSLAKDVSSTVDLSFAFEAPTTKLNAMRVIRALQVRKPILIEGSPGVGKTTLITALAQAAGKPLTRINLSEQTDLMDLFGSDVPVEGADAGHFAWRDAPFLQAMQRGDWVLLDEMNLASQSVLEGLNACLDHRGEVYISELDQTFKRHPNFAVFAAQNPHHQGGGRKGLPSSFVNRFTVVYADVFKGEDLSLICKRNFPTISEDVMSHAIQFVSKLEDEVIHKGRFGGQGRPWEFNLRDILRWLKLLTSSDPLITGGRSSDFLNLIFRLRFRTLRDRHEADHIFKSVFGHEVPFRHYFHKISSKDAQIGLAYLLRDEFSQRIPFPAVNLNNRLPELESLMICVQQNWPCILVGPSGSGKTTLLQQVAASAGVMDLVTFPLNSDTDTMDLVGGFEQIDPRREAVAYLTELNHFIEGRIRLAMPHLAPVEALQLIEFLQYSEADSPVFFSKLHSHLLALQSATNLDGMDDILQHCVALRNRPSKIDSARFEWVDGILIKALEQGRWLVLDNANLCSSSVLDRLNSLLEPNGFLSINEHCGPDGEPKVVKPHPNFRLFLTVDPRFGELSRAMRNRAIEIFLEPLPETDLTISRAVHVNVDTSLQRYQVLRDAVEVSDPQAHMVRVAFDNLAWKDLPLLNRFVDALQNGLLASPLGESHSHIEQLFQRYYHLSQSEEDDDFRNSSLYLYSALEQKVHLSTTFGKTQTIHPLQNSPLVPLLQQSSQTDQAFWLGAILDLGMEVKTALTVLEAQNTRAIELKPSKMNRLQRSIASGRVPALAKDSTAGVASFLMHTLGKILAFVKANVTIPAHWMMNKQAIARIMAYWIETYKLVSASAFEEATFQAHLTIGRALLTDLPSELLSIKTQKLVNYFNEQITTKFDSGFRLTTGLSMEILWKHFRPTPIRDAETLETLRQMEQLAARFDALRWKTSVPVKELGSITNSLSKSYRAVLVSDVDGKSLVEALSSELAVLEARAGEYGVAITPFFASQFEALRQFSALHKTSSDLDVFVLSDQPTVSLMRLTSASDTSGSFQNIDYIQGAKNEIHIVSNAFSASLLSKVHGVDVVDLKSLRLLETELPMLGEKIATASEVICKDSLEELNTILLDLMIEIIEINNTSVGAQVKRCIVARMQGASLVEIFRNVKTVLSELSLAPIHFQQVLQDHFIPAVNEMGMASSHGSGQLRHTALALIHIALGFLVLYVPDRPFDPDRRQWLERERHERMRDILQNKMDALQKFENLFTGQESNLRYQMIEADFNELGEPDHTLQKIYRPAVSELNQLGGEFSHLVKAVLRLLPTDSLTTSLDRNSDGPAALALLRGNAVQITHRLSVKFFHGYSDLTAPIVTMLRCLQVGLSMATSAVEEQTSGANIMHLSKATPFLGGIPSSNPLTSVSDQPLEFLAITATSIAIEGLDNFDHLQRQSLFNVFHSCYEQWSQRLESDRKEAEAKGGLYHFKGSAEDEEEEDQEQFNELFPAYDDDSSNPSKGSKGSKSSRTSRDTAIELSNIHAEMFLENTAPSASTISLIRSISSRIGALFDEKTEFEDNAMDQALLPGALVLLNNQMEALASDSLNSEAYNFYTDANLPEARKLVSLVHQIQTRFKDLQQVDEIAHMQPLEDVLVSCRELLEFRHTEPIAKIITKVEKIHTYMHEWQFGGWASRVNSALALYDSLTSTIVSWRRLELSTWAKLFDMEDKTCQDDAKSWWFVAYQVVVAAPLSMAQSGEDLSSYAQKLLQDLESYFSTAMLGQFMQRLKLLKQLQKHLGLLKLDFPTISVIYIALSNFVEMYQKHETTVAENLRKGRVVLEKAMKDILLLASWKDTNIVALRDSAKRSHHKLFKVVRKYRALLGTPMDNILKNGLPDVNDTSLGTTVEHQSQLPLVDMKALSLCETSVPRWSEKSKRLLNISKTISIMDSTAQLPETSIDAPQYIDSFLDNLISSMVELQKQTPSILTKDNANEVKHLKSRKRKLFADTLKELREMGISYNLGVTTLAKQDSLSIVLANTSYLSADTSESFEGIMYYYHKTLDLIPRARQATRDHSEDLTVTETARCAGYLEGLLQVVVKQHNVLSNAVSDSSRLKNAITMARNLWASDVYQILKSDTSADLECLLRRLTTMLAVASELVRIHSKLGKIDSKEVQNTLSSLEDKFKNLLKQWIELPSLPTEITTTAQVALYKEVEASLQITRHELRSMSQKQPGIAFILKQVLPWTELPSNLTRQVNGKTHTQSNIEDLDQKISLVCNKVFAALEKLQSSIKGLPTSTDDPTWLVKDDASLADSIKSLHVSEITSQIENAFSFLSSLDLSTPESSNIASAVFAVALPIFQQYSNIVHQCTDRYASLHRSSCKMTYILAKSFTQIATQGFCTPSEKSEDQSGKTEKLEGGTGLGDGEGAEDISNDIQDDEDLTELAQEPNQGDKEEIEDEKDAVDMADADMEGEMGEAEEKGSDDEGSGDEESGDEMDEEAGDVDDLDPNAVDEKMWDGDGEKADKDQEGDESKGKASKDEQVAAQDNDTKAGEGDEGEEDEEEEAVGAEQSEEVNQDEAEKHDPHAEEGEALELPEEMELDGDAKSEGSVSGDEEMDNMSNADEADDAMEDKPDQSKDDIGEGEDADVQEDQETGSDLDVVDLDEDEDDEEGEGENTEEAGGEKEEEPNEQPEEDQETLLQDRADDANTDPENAVSSDVQGLGEEQDDNQPEDSTNTSKAQREDGGEGGDSTEEKPTAAADGEKGRHANGEAPQTEDEQTQDTTDAQPFKKLGDALERWHRQQTDIREAPEGKEQPQEKAMDVDVENQEYQHLQDENAEADTQALGTATEEQARALDESMAIDSESKDQPETFQPDEVEKPSLEDEDQEMEDVEDIPQDSSNAHEGRAGAMIQQATKDREEDFEDNRGQEAPNLEEDVEEVDNQLSITHLDDSGPTIFSRSAEEARQLWTQYETSTRDLSLSLTEQLRLILAPTLATKMRGDFRTGKRLNIKRIIPYIASSFKRDKIWMRRSIPSKRSYQIMLAVDDSKSMGASGSGELAFETLAMISKSLSMLEVGEICIVGFGEDVKVAHEFDTPFSADAGPRIFRNFGFEQSKTDVTKLVRQSISLFREARAKASSSPADLWQLQLIISDGVCDSSEHESIRRLLREAIEERIMMVFVIVDDLKGKKKGESVLDLKEAKFVDDGSGSGGKKLVIERYLDTFPFQYYLVVSDVRELPGVLAQLLRQWFAEVVDSS